MDLRDPRSLFLLLFLLAPAPAGGRYLSRQRDTIRLGGGANLGQATRFVARDRVTLDDADLTEELDGLVASLAGHVLGELAGGNGTRVRWQMADGERDDDLTALFDLRDKNREEEKLKLKQEQQEQDEDAVVVEADGARPLLVYVPTRPTAASITTTTTTSTTTTTTSSTTSSTTQASTTAATSEGPNRKPTASAWNGPEGGGVI